MSEGDQKCIFFIFTKQVKICDTITGLGNCKVWRTRTHTHTYAMRDRRKGWNSDLDWFYAKVTNFRYLRKKLNNLTEHNEYRTCCKKTRFNSNTDDFHTIESVLEVNFFVILYLNESISFSDINIKESSKQRAPAYTFGNRWDASQKIPGALLERVQCVYLYPCSLSDYICTHCLWEKVQESWDLHAQF